MGRKRKEEGGTDPFQPRTGKFTLHFLPLFALSALPSPIFPLDPCPLLFHSSLSLTLTYSLTHSLISLFLLFLVRMLLRRPGTGTHTLTESRTAEPKNKNGSAFPDLCLLVLTLKQADNRATEK